MMQIQHVKGKVKLTGFPATAEHWNPETALEFAGELTRIALAAKDYTEAKVMPLAEKFYEAQNFGTELKYQRQAIIDSYTELARVAIAHLEA